MLRHYSILIVACITGGCAHAMPQGDNRPSGELFTSIAYDKHLENPSLIVFWKNKLDVPRCITPETASGETTKITNQSGETITEMDEAIPVQKFEYLRNFVIVPKNGELFYTVSLDFSRAKNETHELLTEVWVNYVDCRFLIDTLMDMPFPQSADVISQSTQSEKFTSSNSIH